MEKIRYPNIQHPAASSKPVIEIPIGAKTAKPEKKEVTLGEAVDQLRVNLNAIATERLSLMLKFAEKRDAKIEEPNHEDTLQKMARGLQFLDQQRSQLLNMYTSGSVLMKTADLPGGNSDERNAGIDEFYMDQPELKAMREEASKSLIKIATQPEAKLTNREIMVVAAFADYYQFKEKLDI